MKVSINFKKPALFLGVFLVTGMAAFSQKPAAVSVTKSSKPAGEDLVRNIPINATTYSFPERIHNFEVDTVQQLLTLDLRNLTKNGKWIQHKGTFLRYDLKQDKVLWANKVNHAAENIEQFGTVSIYTKAGRSYYLNSVTGQKSWELTKNILLADPVRKIGIGYLLSSSDRKLNTLQGFNLSSGRTIWEREISRDFGWNTVRHLNDSTLLIAASGLHTLNLKNGAGWDYHAITGKKDYTGVAVGTGIAIATGILTGGYMVPSGPDIVRDIASNVYSDSSGFYFASKEQIVKLSKQGNKLWSVPLNAELTSKSAIFKTNDRVLLLNHGYAFMGGRKLAFGAPFIAAYHINTGEKQFSAQIPADKKEFIESFDVAGDTLVCIFNNRIATFSLKDGKALATAIFDPAKYGGLGFFLGDHIYTSQNSLFKSLTSLFPGHYFIVTKTGRVLHLNNRLELQDEPDPKTLFVGYLQKNNLTFIAKENQTYVLDKAGKAVAKLDASKNSFLLNNKLYTNQGTTLFEIDLDDLIKM